MKTSILTFLSLILFMHLQAQTVNWNGEKRDGHFNEKNLLKMWPKGGPELIFSIDGIGKGWSTAVVANKTIYITGKKDSIEYLSAINLKGEMKWQVPYSPSWDKAYPDSRGSATIDGDRIYIISGTGVLACFNAETGDEIWSLNPDKEFEAIVSPFGTAESPLVVDDKVICTPAGDMTTVVAYNKLNGKLIWKSECAGGVKVFISPTLYTYKDFRYILAGTSKYIVALIPETGEIAWKYKHYDPSRERSAPGDGQTLVNTPIFKDDEIFISKGYNYPAMMIKMDSTGRAVEEKWINQTLDNDHGGVIRFDDHIYGSNFYNSGMGKWVCLDWESGEVTYVHDWINKGSIISADGLLYLYEARKGFIALVRPNPDNFELISTFKIFKGTGPHWAHLSIFDGVMYVRRGNVLMAYSVKKEY